MARLVRIALALTLLFSAAIGMALRARAGEAGAFLMLLSGPEGEACPLPCLLGIRPGVSTLDEALAALRAHPLTQGYRQRHQTNFNGATGEIGLQFTGPGPTVYLSGQLGARVIALAVWYSGAAYIPDGPPAASPRVGEMIHLIGAPASVRIDASPAYPNAKAFYYANRMMFEFPLAPAFGLDPRMPIAGIGLGLRPGHLRYTRGGMERDWQGLRSAAGYGVRP